MSFTLKVIDELLTADTAKTCCRKAVLFGLFYCARLDAEKKNLLRAEFKSEEAALFASKILQKQFAAQTEPIPIVRAGRKLFCIEVASKALSTFVSLLDKSDTEELSSLVGYRCGECAHSFIRGVFIAAGTINDPQKSYHLEFSLPNAARAQKLAAALEKVVPSPKTVQRAQKTGVYYKSNEAIFDLLNYMGGGESRFLITNTFIERDIRNAENRATNCVASNISKSVDASMKQIEAIRRLIESGKMLSLPEELRYTAELRMENPSASLFELSHLHEPPISKSGLNRRLTRLLEEAEAITNENI
ncbi:MAG: DNA-binding protein WhiA [Ruminococcaceae bacterium]|nr:DNA-binding protein WhiA [Oscillospiraceae bacterium]